MPGAGKGILIAATVGAVIAGISGIANGVKNKSIKSDLTQSQGELEKKTTELSQAKTEASTATAAAKDAKAKMEEATSKEQTLESSLSDAKKKTEELEKSVTDATTAAQAAEDKVKQINETLGKPVDQVKADMQKAADDLSHAQADLHISQDKLQQANLEVDRLTDAINRSKTGKMPGLDGKIMSVNHNWNFVVLNVGDQDGVVPNGILIVYRGKQFVGKVRVVTTEAHTSVADILPEWTKGDIQSGDDVLN